jgi:hypothetical protein
MLTDTSSGIVRYTAQLIPNAIHYIDGVRTAKTILRRSHALASYEYASPLAHGETGATAPPQTTGAGP